jgi:hypothetical protein
VLVFDKGPNLVDLLNRRFVEGLNFDKLNSRDT